MPKKVVYLLTGLILLVLLVATVLVLRRSRAELPALGGDFPRSKGPVDAAVQIIEYSDFQCPACQSAQTILSALFVEFPGRIRLIYQHFPLEGHEWSALAHQAAECAARQNQFWRYHDRLYSTQNLWSKNLQSPLEVFIKYANELGMNLESFSSCLANPSVIEVIQQERSTGSDLGVRSTPSFFVNGHLVVGTQNLRDEVASKK